MVHSDSLKSLYIGESREMNWYLSALKKSFVFKGRARRKEYWYFALFNILISLFIGYIDILTPTTDMRAVVGFYIIVMLIPSISVGVRRLHDTNRTGWWYFITLIPIIGGIVLFVFMVLDSDNSENQFGDNPKLQVE